MIEGSGKLFVNRWPAYKGCWWLHPYIDQTSFGFDGKIPFTNRGITFGFKWRIRWFT